MKAAGLYSGNRREEWHGDKVFSSPTQNKLFENGILWLLGKN